MTREQTSDTKKKEVDRTLVIVNVGFLQGAYSPAVLNQRRVEWKGLHNLDGWNAVPLPKVEVNGNRDIRHVHSSDNGNGDMVLFDTLRNITKSSEWKTDRFWFENKWMTLVEIKGTDKYNQWVRWHARDRVATAVLGCIGVFGVCIACVGTAGYSIRRDIAESPPPSELVNGMPVRFTHPIQMKGTNLLSSPGEGLYWASASTNSLRVRDTKKFEITSETRGTSLHAYPLVIKSAVTEITSLADMVLPGALPVYRRTYEFQLYACDEKNTRCERVAEAPIDSLKDAYIHIDEKTGVLMTGSNTKLTELKRKL